MKDKTTQKKLKIPIEQMVNDPFQGKGGFMPAKIKDKITVRVGLNENLAFPEEVIRELLLDVAQRVDPRIYPEDYCDSLCEIIAREHQLEPKNVIIGNGGDKIIDLAVRLTIKSDMRAVIVQPTYPMYEHATKVQGGDIKELLLTPAPDFDLDPDYILSNITPKKDRLLFLCSPNNPTGNQFNPDKLRTLIQEFPGIVALDETYSDFGEYSLIPELEKYPNLIIMKSMSKFHGMAGMRLGYSLADEFLISRMKELLPAFNVNITSLELAKQVLQRKNILTRIVSDVVNERKRLFNALQKIDGITAYKSFTNFILFRLNQIDAAKVQQKLLKSKGVLVRNMSAMPLCENTLRITVTTAENNTAFLAALKEVLSKLSVD